MGKTYIADSFKTTAGVDLLASIGGKTEKEINTFYIPNNYNFALIGTVTEKNIIISFAHDLLNTTVNFGSNKNITFNGGSLVNGTIQGANCQVVADKIKIFSSMNTTFTGTWLNDVYPEWWGDRSITSYDWQPALQKSLDFVKLSSGKVKLSAYLYTYYNQLTVSSGVSIEGVSRGETALGAAAVKGSVLWCLGSSLGSTTYDNTAIKIVGGMTTLSNFTIKGQRSLTKYGSGIQVCGVGNGSGSAALLEGLVFENLLIHGFQKGKGLHLVAGNSGAITYSNFNNIRLRDCAEHLTIESLSSNPIYGNLGSTGLAYTNPAGFINSNDFKGLYLSGYCESGIKIITQYNTDLINSQLVYTPANNLTFSGVVIEPPSSSNSHIRLEGGGSCVRMHDIRIEALNQNSTFQNVPVVYLGEGVNGVYINGDQCSVPIVDLGYNNRIEGHSAKNANASPDTTNLYKNSAFKSLDKTGTNIYLPEWTVDELSSDVADTYYWRPLQSSSTVTINESSNFVDTEYKTLSISVPPNKQIRIYQDIDRTLHKIPSGKVNCFAKASNIKDVIWTYQDSVTPIVSGGTTFGRNSFEQIGGFFHITDTAVSSYYRISIFCQNYGSTNIDFEITMPSFVVGDVTPALPAKVLTDNGGTIYGVLAYNTVKNIKPISNSNHRVAEAPSDVVLPKDGNFFEINETGFYFQKINANSNRFPRGAVITLLFNFSNIDIIDSNYIDILKPFISKIGSTITLQTVEGNGLWKEISRSEPQSEGLFSGEISPMVSAGYITIDNSYNLFELTNSSATPLNISRINNITQRFTAGKSITIRFVSTGSNVVSIINSGYIILKKTGNWTPNDGDWIKLETRGDGSWYEIERKPLLLPEMYIGYSLIETSASIATSFLTLPITGENYFKLNNSSAGGLSIARINQATQRFSPGTEIILSFGTLTNGLSIVNSAYITLLYPGNFTAITGDWIKLITTGDGTWMEVQRKPSAQYPLDLSVTLSASNLATNFLTLPITGENYFKLSAATLGGSISRVNNGGTARFGGGKIIMLEFINVTNTITLVNSGYLTLAGGVNYTPAVNAVIILFTRGDGTWREMSRF
ncbi:hypothetical protein ACFX5D_04040 [Flavobacterium sp. LB3P45]|uniref:Uncharacterized protein n=1 Tax=Flavobacterium fructosi TaxID=3230416 RepID=A0ABW6HJC6_9FLAO